jgi:hypothetical protein
MELTGLDLSREREQILGICRTPGRDLAKEKDGFCFSVTREIDAITSDSAGVNRKAREIIALRHPRTNMLPCFAHRAALDCADVLKMTKAASVVPECLHLVLLFNASTNKRLPRLCAAMVKTNPNKRSFALKNRVVTRWTSVWLSACSILRAKAAFKLLVAQYPNIAAKVFASNDRRLAELKRSFETIDNSGFWSLLEEYIVLLVPTIESSLVLQGGDATLADVVYCRFRQYVRLQDANESTALNALKRRWSQV